MSRDGELKGNMFVSLQNLLVIFCELFRPSFEYEEATLEVIFNKWMSNIFGITRFRGSNMIA